MEVWYTMKDQIKQSFSKVQETWKQQPKKKKIRIGVLAGTVVLIAVIITVALNMSKPGYKVLYPGMDKSETSKVYAALKDMDVQPQINSKGEVMVPPDKYDELLLKLAEKGYPKTTLTYDIFLKNNGLTTTEFDKKQQLLFQLQNRLQDTLDRIQGVENSAVTINLPEKSDYVWQEASQQGKASAGVLLNFKDGVKISEDQVTAIKNLVSSSVPKLKPEDVKVINGATGLELSGPSKVDKNSYNTHTLEFEKEVQKQIEDNVVRLLSARYGSQGVRAAAKVTLDYDAMMTERKKLLTASNGGGLVSHFEEDYKINGEEAAGGIVGEENNTDVPKYAQKKPNEKNGMTQYHKSIDYDYGYIKTQVEKGKAILKRATISVMVSDKDMPEARKKELTDLVSKSTDIPPDNISVTSIGQPIGSENMVKPKPIAQKKANNMPLWIILSIVGAVILAAVIVFLVIRSSKKKAEKLAAETEEEMESRTQNMQSEIDEYKKQLADAAKASVDPKDDAITNEVRDFARENPEITANLLRSWLKEDDE